MGFKTFLAGNPLAAADLNNFLMAQAVIGCTSGTHPASPQQGMVIYETDTDLFKYWNGSAWEGPGVWVAYTPSWTSSGTTPTLGNGTLTGSWTQIDKTVHGRIKLTIGSTTNGGTGAWSFSVPTARGTNESLDAAGVAFLNQGVSNRYSGTTQETSSVAFAVLVSGSITNALGVGVPVAYAAGHTLAVHFTYEAA